MKLSKKKKSNKSRKNKTNLNLQRYTLKCNIYGGQKMSRKIKRLQGQKRINKYNYRKIKGGVDNIINIDELDDDDIAKINEYLSSKKSKNDDGKIINIDESKLNDTDIAKINEYLSSEKYKKDDGFLTNMSSNLSSLVQNSEFVKYLTDNDIYEKFKATENPKKNVKIVFYSSSNGKKNNVRKYPYFKVFIEDGNTINDNIDQVDTMLAYIIDPKIKKRSDVYKRTINIDIKDLLQQVELEEEAPKNNKENNKKVK
jgi:cytochrome c553